MAGAAYHGPGSRGAARRQAVAYACHAARPDGDADGNSDREREPPTSSPCHTRTLRQSRRSESERSESSE